MNLRDQSFKAAQTLLNSFNDDELEMMNLHQLMIEQIEKGLIEAVLLRCDYNQVWAANVLGMARNTLRKKVLALNIQTKKSTLLEENISESI